mgnify:CR=1 FL=1
MWKSCQIPAGENHVKSQQVNVMSDPSRWRSGQIPAGECHVRSQQVKVRSDHIWKSCQIPGEGHSRSQQVKVMSDPSRWRTCQIPDDGHIRSQVKLMSKVTKLIWWLITILTKNTLQIPSANKFLTHDRYYKINNIVIMSTTTTSFCPSVFENLKPCFASKICPK